MNILCISATYPPSANGVAVSTKRTVDTLRGLGHTVAVIGPTHPDSAGQDPWYFKLPTVTLPFWRAKDYPLPLPLHSVLVQLPKIRWDIIHVHHPFLYLRFALTAGKMLQAPVVYTYHTQPDEILNHIWHVPITLARILNKLIVLDLCRKADGVIATTKWLRTVLRYRIGMRHVYYATTAGLIGSFRMPGRHAVLRNRLGIRGRGPVFLIVSRLVTEKGLEFVVRSFFVWSRHHKDGRLVVIGDGADRDELERIVRAAHMSDRVMFAGKVANDLLHAWYSAADVFVYGSVTDTIGINILEAMSAGLPVVASSHVTTREVVVSGYNGVLTRRSPGSFARGMEIAYRRRLHLCKGAFQTAREYGVSNTVRQLVGVYRQIINSNRTKQI